MGRVKSFVRGRLSVPRTRDLVLWLVIAAVATGAAAGVMRLRVETTVESFLPRSDPSVAAMEQNARQFGGNPVVTLLESAQPRDLVLGDRQLPALMQMEGRLAKLPDVATVYGPGTVMNQIAISSQDMLARLSGTRDGLRARAETEAREKGSSANEVKAAGDAATVDFDKRYGALLVRGLPAGLPTTNNPSFVKNVIYDASGAPRPQWHFVVPNEHSVAVLVRPRENLDEAGTRRLVDSVRQAVHESGLTTTRATTTGVPAITAALTDEAIGEIPLLGGLALLVLILRFLVVPSGSGFLRRPWPLLAAVIGSVLTLSAFGWAGLPMSVGAIVLFPLLLGIGSSFPLYLARSPNRRRVLVVSAASAVSFGCLAVSSLPFVRELGIALGLGVACTVGATLVLDRAFSFTDRFERLEPAAEPDGGSRPVRGRWAVLGVLVAVAAAGWAMLPALDVRANPEDVARGLPELQDAQYAEQVLGSSGEVSVVLHGTDVRSPQALQWMAHAEDEIIARHGDLLRPVLTVPDLLKFLGGAPSPQQISAGLQLLPPYLTNAVFSQDGQQATLTFGLKFGDLGRQSALLGDVGRVVPPPPDGSRFDVVGLPVAVARAYDLVSADRMPANIAGIVAAGAVLLIWLRRRSDALRAMLAAAMATGWMLAGLWLAGIPLNPLTVALGSLATVTACEFTVLLAGGRRRPEVRRMVAWACLTSVLGYLALLPSKIGLLREFGITLGITVLFSYLAAIAAVRLIGRAREVRTDVAETAVRERKPAEVSS
jgi:predicted RND superfamily exporter protein